jgi:hypothetical protein
MISKRARSTAVKMISSYQMIIVTQIVVVRRRKRRNIAIQLYLLVPVAQEKLHQFML